MFRRFSGENGPGGGMQDSREPQGETTEDARARSVYTGIFQYEVFRETFPSLPRLHELAVLMDDDEWRSSEFHGDGYKINVKRMPEAKGQPGVGKYETIVTEIESVSHPLKEEGGHLASVSVRWDLGMIRHYGEPFIDERFNPGLARTAEFLRRLTVLTDSEELGKSLDKYNLTVDDMQWLDGFKRRGSIEEVFEKLKTRRGSQAYQKSIG